MKNKIKNKLFKPINASVIRITNNKLIRKQDSLFINNEIIFTLGDSIITKVGNKETEYFIKFIKKIKKGEFNLLTTIPNKTEMYILPCLEIGRKHLSYISYFTNCYLSEDLSQIYVILRFVDSNEYRLIEKNLQHYKVFNKIIEIDEFHTGFVFDIPNKFSDDINIFLKGKYSKLSDYLKKCILKFHSIDDKLQISKIITKDNEYRKILSSEFECEITGELESKPILINEILKK